LEKPLDDHIQAGPKSAKKSSRCDRSAFMMAILWSTCLLFLSVGIICELMTCYRGDPTKASGWRHGVWISVVFFILFAISAVIFTNFWQAEKTHMASLEPNLEQGLNTNIQGEVPLGLWVRLGKGNVDL
jgi:hypothetical protein